MTISRIPQAFFLGGNHCYCPINCQGALGGEEDNKIETKFRKQKPLLPKQDNKVLRRGFLATKSILRSKVENCRSVPENCLYQQSKVRIRQGSDTSIER